MACERSKSKKSIYHFHVVIKGLTSQTLWKNIKESLKIPENWLLNLKPINIEGKLQIKNKLKIVKNRNAQMPSKYITEDRVMILFREK